MDKQEFLSKLRSCLRGFFTKKEIEDIISDYNDFFSAGENEKTERQICIELGDPANIAFELKEEFKKKRQLVLTSKTAMRLLLTLPLIAIAVFIYTEIGMGWGTHKWVGVAGVVVFAVILRFILDSGGILLKIAAKIPYRAGKLSLIIDHVVLLLFPVTLYIFLTAALNNSDWFVNLMETNEWGYFFKRYILIASTVTIVIMIFSLLGYYRNVLCFSVICLGLSSMVYYIVISNILSSVMDNTAVIEFLFLDALVMYGMSMILSCLASILFTVIKTYLKKREGDNVGSSD